jgi:uncharacterized protein with HEPN domain
MSRDLNLFLRDILQSMLDIECFVKDMDYEKFVEDRRTVNAVLRSIEVIGEAVFRAR